MSGAGRRQNGGCKTFRRKGAGKSAGRLPIEGNRCQTRRPAAQSRKWVSSLIADRCVGTAGSITRQQHVPDTEAMREHTIKPLLIRQPQQRLSKQIGQQAPELVTRMRVVLAGRKRRLRWEATEHHPLDVDVDDRRETE